MANITGGLDKAFFLAAGVMLGYAGSELDNPFGNNDQGIAVQLDIRNDLFSLTTEEGKEAWKQSLNAAIDDAVSHIQGNEGAKGIYKIHCGDGGCAFYEAPDGPVF